MFCCCSSLSNSASSSWFSGLFKCSCHISRCNSDVVSIAVNPETWLEGPPPSSWVTFVIIKHSAAGQEIKSALQKPCSLYCIHFCVVWHYHCQIDNLVFRRSEGFTVKHLCNLGWLCLHSCSNICLGLVKHLSSDLLHSPRGLLHFGFLCVLLHKDWEWNICSHFNPRDFLQTKVQAVFCDWCPPKSSEKLI